ncbi:MAG: hypothetical protein IPL16_18570 [Ignavibacteria bacterium]|nr:hypothetical protein [Ignavibacteria bacterium]
MRLKRKVKFITLYNTFSETERNHFKLFISSPLFNGGRDYSDIIEDIESHKFKYSELTVTKANRTLWNRLSELTKLAERFLVIKSAENEKYIFDLFLLKEFRKRNLDEYFKKEIEKQLLDIKITLPATLESNIFFEINDLYLEYLKSKADDKKFEAQFREDANYKIAFFALDLLDRLIQLWERKLSKSISSDLYIESFFQTLDLKNLLVHIKKKTYPICIRSLHFGTIFITPSEILLIIRIIKMQLKSFTKNWIFFRVNTKKNFILILLSITLNFTTV